MAAPPNHHWFRFRLRTLFVLATVLAVGTAWITWNKNLVTERRALLNSLEGPVIQMGLGTRPGKSIDEWPYKAQSHLIEKMSRKLTGYGVTKHEPTAPYRLSLVRRWLGDELKFIIAYYEGPDVDRVRELFPEAVVVVANTSLAEFMLRYDIKSWPEMPSK